MTITAIVDLQFGSTGKGLIAGYLSQRNKYDLVVSANMPNAGHTFVDAEGKKWISKVLPSGVYSPGLRFIAIGPGAVFDIGQLAKEIGQLREQGVVASVVVHPDAGILLPEHREAEQRTLSGISSTMQGSMEAMYQKMRRLPGKASNVAMSYEAEILKAGAAPLSHQGWLGMVSTCKEILMEGSQGYSLGINAGFYPYCTSRDCTVWRLIADCGMMMNAHKLKVIGTARVHPIRVGNTADGNSGGCYRDQKELTWEELGQTPETTTVTGRIRRVFSFSYEQVAEACLMNKVDEIFLNFANYDVRAATAIIERLDLLGSEMMEERGAMLFGSTLKFVRYVGFGPQAEDIIDRGEVM